MCMCYKCAVNSSVSPGIIFLHFLFLGVSRQNSPVVHLGISVHNLGK